MSEPDLVLIHPRFPQYPEERVSAWLTAYDGHDTVHCTTPDSPLTASDLRALLLRNAQLEESKEGMMLALCTDTYEYDNALCDVVCDKILGLLIDGREPSFGGPRLNALVRLIRSAMAQHDTPERSSAPLDFTPEGVRVREGVWEPHEAITRAREILRQYGGRDE